jgi:hypothetical protein
MVDPRHFGHGNATLPGSLAMLFPSDEVVMNITCGTAA